MYDKVQYMGNISGSIETSDPPNDLYIHTTQDSTAEEKPWKSLFKVGWRTFEQVPYYPAYKLAIFSEFVWSCDL